jgi:phosphoribosylglycinamide formyltransferase 1
LKNLAIFASGSGSNAERIVEYFQNSATVNIKLFLTNNPQAGVIERAKRLNISIRVFDRQEFKSETIVDLLKENKIDWVILAGFLWLIPKNLVEVFPSKIVNIHPALLPKFGGKGMYGHFVHEAVVANKETESGITIHLVNEHYDEGTVVFQASFPVSPEDTPEDVARKVQALEHKHFPKIIAQLITVK